MQTALDFAAYALGATLLVGLLLLSMLAYDLWLSDRFRAPHPSSPRLPCLALEAAREVVERMKTAYAKASAQERRHMDVHLRRMGERVRAIEDRTFAEQDSYYRAIARREKQWRGWKALHAQVRQMSRADRARSQHLLDEAAVGFRKMDRAVKEEWEHGLYRDKLLREELRTEGLLDEDYLAKLLAQVRTHMAHAPADPEDAGWEEPGLEAGLETRLETRLEPAAGSGAETGLDGGGQQGTENLARAGDAPGALAGAQAADAAGPAGESSTAPQQVAAPQANAPLVNASQANAPLPPAAPVAPPRIGRLSYGRIRELLAPLFGRKAAPEETAAPIAPDAESSPGAWQPTPPPPRVESHPVQAAPETAGAATGAALPGPGGAGATAVLRQQDVVADALAAPGRQYGDPEFSVADLPHGILRHADLSAGDFSGVRFTGRHRYLDCRFSGADLSRIVLEAESRAHQFVRCDFSGAQFDGSRLCFALFHECNLSGSHWHGARLEHVRFSDCQLDGADWNGADLVETELPGGTAAPPPPTPPAEPPR